MDFNTIKYTGFTTIEEVREIYNNIYNKVYNNLLYKIKLKAWLCYSESRTKNGNSPMTFENYTNHMRNVDYLGQIECDMLDCSDIGGKDAAIEYLKSIL